MRQCTACAKPAGESGHFCPDCGARLVELAVAEGASSARGTVPGAAPPAPRARTASASNLIGCVIDGQFELEAVLGTGAFGTVYRGRQLGLDRPVAVKVPSYEIAADPVMARRFAREARAAARIDHPDVVAIYAVGELEDGRPYLAMQYIDGSPLDRILADGPLPVRRALTIARAIASVLSETHAAGVIHRDLKPSNIMWRVDRNSDDRITLVDFGIAVCKPGNADATRLTSGGLIGTPHYMSPEQAQGEQVDARADLYALGCLLFELVTGAPPFDGTAVEVLLAHLGRPAPAPSERDPELAEAIDLLCATLLAKRPDDRPPDADAVVAMLDATLDALDGRREPARPTPSRPHPRRATAATRRELPPQAPRRQRRARWALVGGAVCVLGLAGGVAAIELAHTRSAAAPVRSEPTDQPDGPVDPHGAHRRQISADDGELVLRALVPDPIRVGHDVRPHLVIQNKLGQPIDASEIVMTITGPDGEATGLTAQPHGRHAGHYGFHYTFPRPGRYVIRLFPPSVDSSFDVPVDVLAGP